MEQFSQNTYWMLAEDLIQPKQQERSPHNQVGRKKKKKKKELGQDLYPVREPWKRKGYLTLGTPFTGWKISQDRQGASEAQRRVQQPVCSRQNTERPAQTVHATTLYSPAREAWLLGHTGPGCWNLGFSKQTQGEVWGWLHGDSLKGLEWGPGPQLQVCEGQRSILPTDPQKPKRRELKNNTKKNYQTSKGKTKRKEQRWNTKSTGKQGLKWQYIHINQ